MRRLSGPALGQHPSGEAGGLPRSQQQGPVAHLVKRCGPGATGADPHGWGQACLSAQPQPLLYLVTLGSTPPMSAISGGCIGSGGVRQNGHAEPR